MTTDVTRAEAPTQTELLALLDPERDYGDRTHEEVVRGVIGGTLVLEPGYSLPVIKDTSTGRMVRGSGRVPGNGGPLQEMVGVWRKLAVDDVEPMYRLVAAKALEGTDFHWADLWLKFTMPKLGESRGGDEMGKALQMLIARLDTPELRSIPIEQVS